MSELLKIDKLTLVLIAGFLFLLTSSNSFSSVNAQPTNTTLTITVSHNLPWIGCTLQATLTDENGNPLQNMDIDFFYAHMDGDGTWCEHKFGTAKTDSNGVASQIYRVRETLRFQVYFKGSTNYASSTSEYIVIVDYTPYLVGGVIIAVAIYNVLAIYIVFLRRKEMG